MIAYPVGQEPDFWDPVPGHPGHRFALGRISGSTPAAPPLIAIGMNPSHAREDQSDKTINRLIKASTDLDSYSGWLMLNLYPERWPKPSALSEYDPELSAANCEAIERVLLHCGATEVLGAWGNIPHRTLKLARVDVLALLNRMGVRMFTLDPLTALGNPRHPHPPGRPLPMLGPKQYIS